MTRSGENVSAFASTEQRRQESQLLVIGRNGAHDGPWQRTLCYLGELNDSTQARWLKTIEVFNEQGETQQLKLFPSEVAAPEDDPNVVRVRLDKVRLERTRQFGNCFLGWELWKRL